MESGLLQEVCKVLTEQMEVMEEMAATQKVCRQLQQLLGLPVRKVSEAKKVLMELQVQAVRQESLEVQEQLVQMDQRVQLVLQVAVQLERRDQQVQMETMVQQVSLVLVERQEQLDRLK
jgi:hypothetical protein